MKKMIALVAVALSLVCAPARAQLSNLPQVASVANVSNAYTGNVANFSSWQAFEFVLFSFTPNASNTGDSTLQLNGNVAIVHFKKLSNGGLVTLALNDLIANQPVLAFYDGSTVDIVNTGTSPGAVALPQGYLTPCQLTSGSPAAGCVVGQLLPTTDVTTTGALYYEPAFGNSVPIYNGTAFVNFTFTELSLAIPSSRLGNTVYDVFVFSNAGSPTPCMGPAWTTSTPGSGARGSGAGTTQVAQTNGIYTNAVSISCVNGASTFTVPANQGTYVATCLMNNSAGQVSYQPTYGQSRQWGCWNLYNRQLIILQAGDPTSSWTYATATVRPSNNSTANQLATVNGIPLDPPVLQFLETAAGSAATGVNAGCQFGIGVNSTTAFSGTTGQLALSGVAGSGVAFATGVTSVANYWSPPVLGVNVYTSLEKAIPANGCVIDGQQPSMVMTAKWRG